jgi:hypothetical protein
MLQLFGHGIGRELVHKMQQLIALDEIGRFWVVDDDDNIISGPYDTQEDALSAYPDADPYY